MTFTFRRLVAGLLFGMALLLLIPQGAEACGTACSMPEAPACADCQYTFFTRTRCSRTNCYTCIEYDCWVSKPAAAGDRLASSEQGRAASPCQSLPESTHSAPKVVRVQILPARS